jgi:hypothetical protein
MGGPRRRAGRSHQSVAGREDCTAPISARKNSRPRFSRGRKINRVRSCARLRAAHRSSCSCSGACWKFRPAHSLFRGASPPRSSDRRPPALLPSAVGANPVAFIIPRHRAIRETGVLGNYRWDPICKGAMIGWEISARSPLQRGTDFRSVGRSGFQLNPHSRGQDARLPHRQDACAT